MDRLDKNTATTLIVVFSVISLVVAGAFFLIYLYSPSEEPAQASFEGILLYEDGTSESCPVKISGSVASFPFEVKPTTFKSNVYSNRQGLFVGDRRIIPSVFLGWYDKEDNIVCQVRNGIRFYTDKSFSFLMIILPDGKNQDKIAIGPAATAEEAKTLIDTLAADPVFSRRWPDVASYIDSYTQ